VTGLRQFALAGGLTCSAQFSLIKNVARGEVIYETRLKVEEKTMVCKRAHLGNSGCFRVEDTPPAPVPERIEEGFIYEEISVEEYEAVRESCTGHGGAGRIPIARCGSTRCGR
jgi:hypothetical protein